MQYCITIFYVWVESSHEYFPAEKYDIKISGVSPYGRGYFSIPTSCRNKEKSFASATKAK